MITCNQLPLEGSHREANATFGEFEGWAVPASYDGPDTESRRLRGAVGVVDLSCLTLVEATGADCADYLHRLLTQGVKRLGDGVVKRAALLNALGRMEADLEVCREGERLLLLSPPYQGGGLAERFGRFVFSERCQFQHITPATVMLALIGPKVCDLMLGAGIQPFLPGRGLETRTIAGIPGVRMLKSEFVPGGVLLCCIAARGAELWRWSLEAARGQGGGPAGWDAFHALRIEAGCAWWGPDLNSDTIPLEAGLGHAIDYNKGCYPGQETIARITNLGHPARKLVGLEFTSEHPPRTGAVLKSRDGEDVGVVTSSCRLLEPAKTIGLGVVKWPAREPGTELSCLGAPAAVVALPWTRV
ncbi:aminomethyl transferase family protein [Candidatus Poribacteria bacterium]|nr:aminomethyl transferase family protein [Candidatus Poribacteria bacterium]